MRIQALLKPWALSPRVWCWGFDLLKAAPSKAKYLSDQCWEVTRPRPQATEESVPSEDVCRGTQKGRASNEIEEALKLLPQGELNNVGKVNEQRMGMHTSPAEGTKINRVGTNEKWWFLVWTLLKGLTLYLTAPHAVKPQRSLAEYFKT